MKNKEVSVSVIVASFNYLKFLPETLSSIYSQNYSNFEIIVVDDGSTDGSLEYLKQQEQSGLLKVYLHPHHENKGLNESLLLALSKAKGDWIAFLESDDFWDSNCLSKRFATIDNNPKTSIVTNGISPVLEKGTNSDWFNAYFSRVKNLLKGSPSKSLDIEILKENLIPTFSSAMVKKEALLECDFSCPIAKWTDWYVWIQLFQKNKVMFVDENLTYWRLHSSSQNRKSKIGQYLKDYKSFRNSIENRLILSGQITRQKWVILNQPIFIPILRRILLNMKQVGARKIFKEIINRFV